MGSCWRVGIGSQIAVVFYAWISKNVNYRLVVDVWSVQNAKVLDLIDDTSKVWKKDVIINTFS